MDKAGNGFCFFVRSRKVRERYFCCKSLFSRSLVEVVSFLYFTSVYSCGYEAERENAQTESGRESFLPPFFF